MTVIMLVPAALTCASMVLCAPLPSATIVMTAPTPMIMPSIVSIVRILFRERAFSAITRVMNMDMFFFSLGTVFKNRPWASGFSRTLRFRNDPHPATATSCSTVPLFGTMTPDSSSC